MSLERLQRAPLVLAVMAIAMVAGPQSSQKIIPSAPAWERSAGMQFDSVSFEESPAQPLSITQQSTAKPATLPFVAQGENYAENKASAQRWVF
ncbi:hypothetical protein [Pseudomonas profundi]|uniref:hypothetical protein n=1 Tax=Pseudomonas profundi TaxID=1981513 RepID=UPI001239CE2F|nr:hypothetical protein [Pseudomonas profundi]